jgi:hypothetical protein
LSSEDGELAVRNGHGGRSTTGVDLAPGQRRKQDSHSTMIRRALPRSRSGCVTSPAQEAMAGTATARSRKFFDR